MKKILFIISIILINVNFTKAITLESVDLPYYVKIKDVSNNKEVFFNVKKIYNKDTLEEVFNINYNYSELTSDYQKYSEYRERIWKGPNDLYVEFPTIVYYGYNSNKSDFNYYLTQAIIWRKNSSYKVSLVNENGEIVNEYENILNDILCNISYHTLSSPFFNKTYERKLWEEDKFTYSLNSLILDNPITDAFNIRNNGNDLYITPLKPGKYKLNFTKKSEVEVACYSDGNESYWQSLKGPVNITRSLTYIVNASNFKIKEELKGINNRYGDVVLNNSLYEIYDNNEKLFEVKSNEEVYLNNDNEYLIKDISNNEGINNIDDYLVNINSDDYVLNIKKEVVSKNITFNINDNANYYVYLKSNNELYNVVNKDDYLITLPYGIYYIKNDNYYNEIIVNDGIDELFTIKGNKEEVIDKIEASNLDDVVNNPKTGGSPIVYYGSASVFLLLIIGLVLKLRNII